MEVQSWRIGLSIMQKSCPCAVNFRSTLVHFGRIEKEICSSLPSSLLPFHSTHRVTHQVTP